MYSGYDIDDVELDYGGESSVGDNMEAISAAYEDIDDGHVSVDLLRRQVTELSKEMAVLPKRLDDLQKQVAHLTNVVGEGSKESPVATRVSSRPTTTSVSLKFGDDLPDRQGKTITIEFNGGSRPNPISRVWSWSATHVVMGGFRYEAGFTKLVIDYKKYGRIEITDNLQEAYEHFSSVVPFAYLSKEDFRPVLAKLHQILPITKNNPERCRKVFALLANNPPGGEDKGVRWFDGFHVTAADHVRELINSWKSKK
ncbi:hypothetical protein FOZ60_000835 [Perkinsus olseni]|uniref:Uncharacterized protein n=1 Tax=Perkinsus olseni TaxID=32597 RepID=A0A7J6PJN2_PEROL|nr:hypothetical protein FOZ60_000835 [Perkinsus olseni]